MKGQNLRIAILVGGVEKYIAGALTFDLNIQTETLDASTKDSTDGWAEKEPGEKSWNGSGQARLVVDAAEVAALKGWEISDMIGKTVKVSFNESDGDKNRETVIKRKVGNALLTSWKITSGNKENINCDFSFEGTGELKTVPEIAGAQEVELEAAGTTVSKVYTIGDGSILSASTDAPWLTVSVNAQNKVTFRAQAYEYDDDGDDPRFATVVLSSGDALYKVRVSQHMKQLVPGPEISGDSEIDLAAAGQTIRRQYATSDGSKLRVNCDADWLNVSIINNKVTFTAAKYDYIEGGANPREADVVLSVYGTTSVFHVAVSQEMSAAPDPTISGTTEFDAKQAGGTYKRQYQVSDGSALVANTEEDWIHPSVDENNKVTFVVDAYAYEPEGTNPRQGIVILSVPDTAAELEVTISQPMGVQPTISGDDAISFEAEGGSTSKNYVASDGSTIAAETDAEWLNVAIENGVLTVEAEEYPYAEEGDNPRTANITLSTETYAEKTIAISQVMGEEPVASEEA